MLGPAKTYAFVNEFVIGVGLDSGEFYAVNANCVKRGCNTVYEPVVFGIFASVDYHYLRGASEECEHTDFFFGAASEFIEGRGVKVKLSIMQ